MTYRPRPYLAATISPRASLVVLRAMEKELLALAAALGRSAQDVDQEIAGEVLAGVASMRESVRQWQKRADEDEVPAQAPAASARMPVAEVAAQACVSSRQVTKLIAPEGEPRTPARPLSGVMVGGRWFLDREPTLAWLEARAGRVRRRRSSGSGTQAGPAAAGGGR